MKGEEGVAKENNNLKKVLGDLLKGEVQNIESLIRRGILPEKPKIVNGNQVFRISIAAESGNLSHRSYQRLSEVGGSAKVGRKYITVTIPDSQVVYNYVKSHVGMGDALEALFGDALIKAIMDKWGNNAGIQEKGKAIRGVTSDIAQQYRKIFTQANQLDRAATYAAEVYVESYLSSYNEVEEYLQHLLNNGVDFQEGFARTTAVGDIILKSGNINIPPRVIELKNYGLPTDKDDNPSIRWLTSSDRVLFGDSDTTPVYLRYLYQRNMAYNKSSDNIFLQNYEDNLGRFLQDRMQQIGNLPDQLKFILKKQRKNPGKIAEKEHEILNNAKKIVVEVSSDGSKIFISGPLEKIEEDIEDKEKMELSFKSEGRAYEILQSPGQKLATMTFDDRGFSSQKDDALKKGNPEGPPEDGKFPSTTIQTYVHYALLKMGNGTSFSVT